MIVWRPAGRGPVATTQDLRIGAAQLFQLIPTTAHYNRSLVLTIEQGRSYREYADDLGQVGSLDALEQLEAAQRMTTFEVSQLGKLEEKHGFAYGAFLGICYSLIARSAFSLAMNSMPGSANALLSAKPTEKAPTGRA